MIKNYLLLQFFVFVFLGSAAIILPSDFDAVFNQVQTVTIIGTNDIQGWAFPEILTRKDNGDVYNYGGLNVMASLIKIIKDKNPGNTLYFDAGDQFQGGIQNSPLISNGRIINAFFNHVGLDGAAIGSHEFDLGKRFLKKFIGDRIATNLALNIRQYPSEQDNLEDMLINIRPSKIYTLSNGIKIGAIGLSNYLATKHSIGFFPPLQIKDTNCADYFDYVMRQSNLLRNQGANAVIVVGHLGEVCTDNPTYGIWTADSVQSQCKHRELERLLREMPKGYVDAVVQGHQHTFAHHYFNGIPFIGTPEGGKYLNLIELKFVDGKLVDSFIEGPIPVCELVFQNTGRCNYIDDPIELSQAGALAQWRFKDVIVEPCDQFTEWMGNVWLPQMTQYREEICQNQIHLKISSDSESELGNLLLDIMQKMTPSSSVSILSPIEVRAQWYPGPIKYSDAYRMFPVDFYIVSFSIQMKQLIRMLTLLQESKNGFHFTYPLQQAVYISQDGNTRGFVTAQWMNGSLMETEVDYQVEVLMFETTLMNLQEELNFYGGLQLTYSNRKQIGKGRELFVNGLREYGTIKADTLIDLEKPRIIVQKETVIPFMV